MTTNQKGESALKPCPFCGKEPKVIPDADAGQWLVSCRYQNCGAWPETCQDNEGNAINVWNRRTLENSLRSEVDRYREALEGLMADVGGGKKHCEHSFTCGCAWENARKILAEVREIMDKKTK